MAHKNTLQLKSSALCIIDMQEAFRSKIAEFTDLSLRIAMMCEAAKLLHLPALVTEQYPKGLGHTAAEIKSALLPETVIVEKTTFSSCGVQPFREQLESTKARQIIVCGIEAHICVNQTVHDLLADNYQVHLLVDCIGSRSADNRMAGLAKMQMSGAIPSSVELCLFELLRDAKHEQFKAVQRLVR